MDGAPSFFETKIDGPVCQLILNRPDKANSMTPTFWRELPATIKRLDDDPSIRAVVLTANGKNFTGGIDLASFQGLIELMQKEPGRAAFAFRRTILELQASFNAFEESRLPIIASIHGACLGGGVDMISACDMRLATMDAYFSIGEIDIGMAADVGTLQRMPKLVPPGIVKELAFTGRRFSSPEAHGWGFVNELLDDREAVHRRALELAHEIAAKSPLAIAGIKKAVDYARDNSVGDALEQVATWNAGMLRPEDLIKALQAKAAKKTAVYADLEKQGNFGG